MQRLTSFQRLEHVAAGAGGNVHEVNRALSRVSRLDRATHHALEQLATYPNAAPADPVQVIAIDESADRRDSVRTVAIDVIERAAGIESRFPAEANAAAQTPDTSEKQAEETVEEPSPGQR